MNLVKVNDEFIDLSDAAIATSFQNGSIGDLATRNVSYSNAFKVPKSEKNRRIFGFADLTGSRYEQPYVKLPAIVLQNGIQIIKGTVVIRDAEEFFNINVYEILNEVFTSLGEKLLSELDFGDTPITWNAAFVDSKRNASSGLVAPVIQYGQIDTGPTPPAIGTYPLPSIYAKDVFEQIFEEAGYSLIGNFLSEDPYFSKLILAYSRPDFPGVNFTKAQILPDTRQVDFIKEITVMFGLKYTAVNDYTTGPLTIDVRPQQSILQDRVRYVDWTRKRSVESVDLVRFAFENFAQENTFDENLNYSISVPNENISSEPRNIYTKKAFPADADTYNVNDGASTMQGAQINLWDTLPAGYPPTTPFDNVNKLRFLLVRAAYTAGPVFEPAFLYDGNSRSDYLVGFYDNFVAALGYKTLLWRNSQSKGLLDLYYAALETALVKCKVVARKYYLTEMDIHNLDLTKLVFDSGDWLLINKLESFVPGQLTRAELLKI